LRACASWPWNCERQSSERRHKFAVAYDEFTADNALNRVFRFVIERLWHLTRDHGNRKLLGELRQWLDEVTLLPSVTVADAKPALLTRLNRRYEPLLNLARLFLENRTLQLAAGDLTTFAFVFDMNELFEAFVINFICRYRQEILSAALQTCAIPFRPSIHSILMLLPLTLFANFTAGYPSKRPPKMCSCFCKPRRSLAALLLSRETLAFPQRQLPIPFTWA
jgi:hypothetical protein